MRCLDYRFAIDDLVATDIYPNLFIFFDCKTSNLYNNNSVKVMHKMEVQYFKAKKENAWFADYYLF